MVKEDLSMKRCEDCDHYNHGMCEHHFVDFALERAGCRRLALDFSQYERDDVLDIISEGKNKGTETILYLSKTEYYIPYKKTFQKLEAYDV